jgi:hypothetical protein
MEMESIQLFFLCFEFAFYLNCIAQLSSVWKRWEIPRSNYPPRGDGHFGVCQVIAFQINIFFDDEI